MVFLCCKTHPFWILVSIKSISFLNNLSFSVNLFLKLIHALKHLHILWKLCLLLTQHILCFGCYFARSVDEYSMIIFAFRIFCLSYNKLFQYTPDYYPPHWLNFHLVNILFVWSSDNAGNRSWLERWNEQNSMKRLLA